MTNVYQALLHDRSAVSVTHNLLSWQHSELGSIKIPMVRKLEGGRSLVQRHRANAWQNQNLYQGVGRQNPYSSLLQLSWTSHQVGACFSQGLIRTGEFLGNVDKGRDCNLSQGIDTPTQGGTGGRALREQGPESHSLPSVHYLASAAQYTRGKPEARRAHGCNPHGPDMQGEEAAVTGERGQQTWTLP